MAATDIIIGHQCKLALGITAADAVVDFLSESMREAPKFVESVSIRTTRSHFQERNRLAEKSTEGSITMEPNRLELEKVLPYILGTAEAADVYALADTLLTFKVEVYRVAKLYTYSGCRVNKATFSCDQGGILKLVMDILGQTCEETAGTGVAIATALAGSPFVLYDSTVSIPGAYQVSGVEIGIDNALMADHFTNSVTRPEAPPPTDRFVTCNIKLPWSVTSQALIANLGVTTGVAVTVRFDANATNLIIAMPKVVFGGDAPVVEGRSGMYWNLKGICKATNARNDEIVFTVSDGTT